MQLTSCRTTRRRPEGGFSLIEVVVVVAIVIVVSSFSIAVFQPFMQNSRVTTAYHTAVMQVRRARQAAVDERRVHRVTFTAPRTIVTHRREVPSGTWTSISQVDLPYDIELRLEPGMPIIPAQTPDGLGATQAIYFGVSGENIAFFQPDGSALDSAGRISNGVAYFARPSELKTSRAVTFLGATGRVKGWRLVQELGLWVWR